MIYHYKLGLAQVEARLAEHRSQELKYYEKIRVLEFKTESGANCIESLTKDLEFLKKEKDELETKLTGFQTASKDLDNLLESQRLDKNKKGLRYSAVPPPPTQIYSPPKKDMSWTGLSECKDDTVTDYSRPSPAIESTSDDAQNRNPFVIETEASPSTILPKSFIKFVKANDSPTKSKTNKVETTKKPPVKYAEQYKKPTKNLNVRGNQRNWNNLKSHHLGKFEAKGDEGYFIGYSMSSKAFRIFNKRTKRVEENLHVEFLENKAIEKGASLNWLFDTDSLTKSINYVPVDAGTNSTNLSGTKDAASQEVKKDVSSLRYTALSNWVHEALLESSLMETPIPTVSSPVLIAYFTDSQEPSSDTRLISKRVANQVKKPSLDNILTLTNRFKDILRVTTNSVDSNRVEADISDALQDPSWVKAMQEELL
nr:retrovirus-related Pol polyprotein from transposon TNT 1-94 [Tanacetum cinerariifolium]